MTKQIHTMFNKNLETWYNKKDGTARVSSSGFKTQLEAIISGRNIACNQGLEHVIHRRDNNLIREKNSYGRDPYPPKG